MGFLVGELNFSCLVLTSPRSSSWGARRFLQCFLNSFLDPAAFFEFLIFQVSLLVLFANALQLWTYMREGESAFAVGL